MSKNILARLLDYSAIRLLLMMLILALGVVFVSLALNNPTSNPPEGSGNALYVASGAPANTIYINSSGNVGIGTTTNPSAQLDIEKNTTYNAGMGIDINQTGTGNARIAFQQGGTAKFTLGVIGTGSALDSGKFFIGTSSLETNPRFVIGTNGYVGIGTTTPGYALDVNGSVRAAAFLYLSDERLKANVQPLGGEMAEKILSLKPVSFNFIGNRAVQTGLIAQDVVKIFPEYVQTDAFGYQSIDYARLIVPLIYTVQQQQQQLNALQSRLIGE
jgi:hypothetical protein